MDEPDEQRINETGIERTEAGHARRLPSADTVFQLRFELLRHISTMSFLAVGGAITLLQTALADHEVTFSALLGLLLLVGAALTAFSAQSYLVERLGEEVDGESEYLLPRLFPRTRKLERVFQQAAATQLGLGLGLFAAFASGVL